MYWSPTRGIRNARVVEILPQEDVSNFFFGIERISRRSRKVTKQNTGCHRLDQDPGYHIWHPDYSLVSSIVALVLWLRL